MKQEIIRNLSPWSATEWFDRQNIESSRISVGLIANSDYGKDSNLSCARGQRTRT